VNREVVSHATLVNANNARMHDLRKVHYAGQVLGKL
jgi:hypothetical protein